MPVGGARLLGGASESDSPELLSPPPISRSSMLFPPILAIIIGAVCCSKCFGGEYSFGLWFSVFNQQMNSGVAELENRFFSRRGKAT